MLNKKGQTLWIKILGGAFGSSGFIVLAIVPGDVGLIVGTGLIGVGSILITAGSVM